MRHHAFGNHTVSLDTVVDRVMIPGVYHPPLQRGEGESTQDDTVGH